MACQVDALQPPLDAALAAMERFEWVGLTDLFEVGGGEYTAMVILYSRRSCLNVGVSTSAMTRRRSRPDLSRLFSISTPSILN